MEIVASSQDEEYLHFFGANNFCCGELRMNILTT